MKAVKGIADMRSAHALGLREIQAIRDLRAQGLSIEEIARRTGRNRKTVTRHVQGVSAKEPGESVFDRPVLKLNMPTPARAGAMDYLNIKSKGI